jgi:hypothetical protein
MVQVRQGKMNFTTMSDISEGALVLTGTFSINDTPIKILFDSEATHSFISEKVLFQRELQCSRVHSLSTTLLLRFYLIPELPIVSSVKNC